MSVVRRASVNMGIGAADASNAEPEAPYASTKNSEAAVVSARARSCVAIHDVVNTVPNVTAQPYVRTVYAVDVVMSAGEQTAVPIREIKTGASSAPGTGYAATDVSENNVSLVEA